MNEIIYRPVSINDDCLVQCNYNNSGETIMRPKKYKIVKRNNYLFTHRIGVWRIKNKS